MKFVRLTLNKLVKPPIEIPGAAMGTLLRLGRGCHLGPGTRSNTGSDRPFQSVRLATDHQHQRHGGLCHHRPERRVHYARRLECRSNPGGRR